VDIGKPCRWVHRGLLHGGTGRDRWLQDRGGHATSKCPRTERRTGGTATDLRPRRRPRRFSGRRRRTNEPKRVDRVCDPCCVSPRRGTGGDTEALPPGLCARCSPRPRTRCAVHRRSSRPAWPQAPTKGLAASEAIPCGWMRNATSEDRRSHSPGPNARSRFPCRL
jgi:hypothetical protein